MALVLPILIMLIFGIIEFGRIYHAHLTLTSATREGARLGAVGGDVDSIEQRVKESAFGLNPDLITVNITTAARGNPLEVEATYPLEIYTPVFSQLLGEAFQVKGSTTMRVE
ncbi:MAG: hypothetical protein PWQ96_1316 [Clostridia bacterium]|nr:TadE-like protein [Clostridiales bacterium]MDK2985674.1 hypothetical protein [Clostridia bacterium]